MRVSVTPTPARIARPLPLPVAAGSALSVDVTPPPVGDFELSLSSWNLNGGVAAGVTRYSPRVGDTLLGFTLVAELGRGAFARVYLAEQASLANRPVALKITLRPTHEAERLARLQHTNVVPVYSVHDEAPVQIICMPYLGRVTLADLLRAYRAEQTSHTAARKSTSARAARSTYHDDNSKSHSRLSDSKGSPTRTPTWTWSTVGPPPIIGDPIAVLQVMAQLAAGLGHAHERGILHLDIKPANVLLADTGEPMLLDFNLSSDAADPEREQVGGTVPYMPIEQLVDMRTRGAGHLDARTDLYALGVLGFELLTGRLPFPSSARETRDIEAMVATRRTGPPSIRELNPAVTPATAAIIHKLLATEPENRYQNAAELREDIERHLTDKPLKYAREVSLRERFGKWRRRNPRLPMRLAAAGFFALALCLGGIAYIRTEGKLRAEQENSRVASVIKARSLHGTLDPIRLDLVLPGDTKARARGTRNAAELLASYGLPGEVDWRGRTDVRHLTDAQREALAGDLGELLGLLAQATWFEAQTRSAAERRTLIAEAWKLNTLARACFAPGVTPPLFHRQAAAIAPAAGETFTGDTPRDATDARGQFLDAADALAHGRFSDAIKLLDRVVTAEPTHAAAHFCLAYCRHQHAQRDQSLERYDVARVLLPKDPRPAYFRGLVFSRHGNSADAESEFTKALERDPHYADALRHRAVVRYRLGKMKLARGHDTEAQKMFAGAEADISAALDCGATPLFAYYVRSLVREGRGDHAGAEADRKAVASAELKTEEDFVARGWSRMAREPEAAVEDFRKALKRNPRSLLALQNLGHILSDREKGTEKEALAVMDQMVEAYPEYALGIAGRAVLLARMGQHEAARKEIARAQMLSDAPVILYKAACVYSLTANGDEKLLGKAATQLRDALRKGFADVRGMATDPDLKALRDTGEYQEIRRAADTLLR